MTSGGPLASERFGRTPVQAARGAILLALLGGGILFALERLLTRPGTPPSEALRATGIPPLAITSLGAAGVVALAAWGFLQAVRTAPRFELSSQGWRVRGPLGCYLLSWDNVTEVQGTATGGIGFRVSDRQAVAATHEGTEQQRQWLATQEPFGDWDYLFTRAELGADPELVVERIQVVRESSG